MYAAMFGRARAAGTVGREWCDRFLQLYPVLSIRSAQVTKRVRNEISSLEATALFCRCARAAILHGIGGDRLFNMDETGFVQNAKNKKVIVMKGSRNVWCRTVEASFHLSMVAAASSAGVIVLPVFSVPGKRVNRDVMSACKIPGAKVTIAEAGFMTTDVVIKWIAHFAKSVPTPLRRPLGLALDGAGSQIGASIDGAAAEHGVVLI